MRLPPRLLQPLPLLLALAVALGTVGCEEKKTAAEQSAAKVTAFRKRQKNEAIKAYTQLVTKFPDSEHVAEAKTRLQALGPLDASPTPAKKK